MRNQDEPAAIPEPKFRAGDRVTIWVEGRWPHKSIISRPARMRAGEWWYVCIRHNKYGAEYRASMPEKWITYPDESPPRAAGK